MKKLTILLATCCAIILVLFSVQSAEASTTRTVYKASVAADVKATAKVDAKTVVSVKKGEYVTQLKAENGWSQVLVKGQKGYIKTGQLTKASGKTKVVSAKAGLKIYAKPSTSAAVYSTQKVNAKVTQFGTVDSTFSFVQVGNVTGFALTASLKAETTSTASGVSFYTGLVPIGLKSTIDYNYFLSATEGYGGHSFNQAVYKGSKASGSHSVTLKYKGDTYATDIYSETKAGFSFKPSYNRPEVKIKYPAKVGDKQTYTTQIVEFDRYGNDKKVSIKVTATVKAAKSTYKTKFGATFKNVVAVELTGPKQLSAVYVFQLNKGLIYSTYEIHNGEYLYGEAVEFAGE